MPKSIFKQRAVRPLSSAPKWISVCFCLLIAGTLEARPQESTPADPTQTPDPSEPPVDDWILSQPEGAMAEFKMPVQPVLRQRLLTPVENQPPIKIHNYLGVFHEDKSLCLFNYHDLHQAPIEAAVEEAMKEAMLQSLSNVRGRLIAEQKIRYKTYPGKAFEFRFAREEHFYKGLARIFLVGQRQYQIAVMMREDEFDQALADKFLNSFSLLEPDTKPDSMQDAKPDSAPKTEPKTDPDPKTDSKSDSDSKSESDSK